MIVPEIDPKNGTQEETNPLLQTSEPSIQEGEIKKKSNDSFMGATFNLSNSTIGAGVLGLPIVVAETGLIPGIIFITFGALLACTTLTLLHTASQTLLQIDPTKRQYEDIGEYCYGKIVSLIVIILNFGGLMSYTIIMGDLMRPVFLQFGMDPTHWLIDTNNLGGRFLFLALFAIPTIILSNVKRISNMRIFSYLSLLSVLGFSLFMVGGLFAGITKDARKGEFKWAKFSLKMFRSLGTVVFAFGCHTNLCPISSEFTKETSHKLKYAIFGSTSICLIFYQIVSNIGYLSFLDATQSNVVNSYPAGWFTAFFRIVLMISIFLTYPMTLYPCRVSFHNLLMDCYGVLKTYILKKENEDTSKDTTQHKKRFFNSERLIMIGETFFLGLTAFVLAVFIPQVGIVFSLTGSTASTLTSYVWPCLFYLKLCKKRWLSWQVLITLIVLFIGISFGIFVTVVRIMDLVGA